MIRQAEERRREAEKKRKEEEEKANEALKQQYEQERQARLEQVSAMNPLIKCLAFAVISMVVLRVQNIL